MRRLPVINSPAAPEDELAASRPRWHWLGIGAGLTALIWVPLALLVGPFAMVLAERLSNVAEPESKTGIGLYAFFAAAPLLVTYALASFAAGMLVGRFGGRARARDASWAAAIAALVLSLLAAMAPATPFPLAILSFVGLATAGAPLAFVGGRWGERRRDPSAS